MSLIPSPMYSWERVRVRASLSAQRTRNKEAPTPPYPPSKQVGEKKNPHAHSRRGEGL